MLDYLNAGWDGCRTVEAYPWLPTILLGEIPLGYYGPKQSKLAGHFQCFLAVLMRNGAGKLLERISAEDGMGPRRCPARWRKKPCAPCYGAILLVLSGQEHWEVPNAHDILVLLSTH